MSITPGRLRGFRKNIILYESSAEIIGKNIICPAGQHFEPRFAEYLNTVLGKRSRGLSFRGRCLTKTGREFRAEYAPGTDRQTGSRVFPKRKCKAQILAEHFLRLYLFLP